MRRIRDFDTGEIIYCDGNQGSGIMSNIFSKLTSDTSKKIAQIAAEKVITKGSEEIGSAVGSAVGKKIAKKIEGKKNDKVKNNFDSKTNEAAGDQIVKFLQEQNKELKTKTNDNKYLDISQKFDELIS